MLDQIVLTCRLLVAIHVNFVNINLKTIYCFVFRATHMDEMCNFYIMFYTPGRNTTAKTCWSPGPPTYYWDKWDNAKIFHPENAPKTVSVDPDTGKGYEITSRKAKPVVRDEPVEESFVDSLASRYVPNEERTFASLLRKLDASYRKQYKDPLY